MSFEMKDTFVFVDNYPDSRMILTEDNQVYEVKADKYANLNFSFLGILDKDYDRYGRKVASLYDNKTSGCKR